MATIEDVAHRAGVSVATVSRALRGLPNVAPSTRDRVREAASALRYVADPAASRLAAGRAGTIGLAVPMLGSWYFSQMFSGVESACVAAGYDVLPLVVGGAGQRRRFLGELPFRKRVDALVIVDVPLSAEELRRVVTDGGVPVLTVGARHPGVDSTRIDERTAAADVVTHLAALGHRRLAVIGALDDDPFGFSVPHERLAGIGAAAAETGVRLDAEDVVAGNFSFRGGAEACGSLFDAGARPTAVFALSDEMAIGAVHAIRARGLRVPQDVSVVGFDDHDAAAFVELTTVAQPVVRVGEEAVARLHARVEGDRGPATHVRLGTELVIRATTAPPRATGTSADVTGWRHPTNVPVTV